MASNTIKITFFDSIDATEPSEWPPVIVAKGQFNTARAFCAFLETERLWFDVFLDNGNIQPYDEEHPCIGYAVNFWNGAEEVFVTSLQDILNHVTEIDLICLDDDAQ